MTPEEFVIWFKGFATAANPYNITPKQWDDIKEQLEKENFEITYIHGKLSPKERVDIVEEFRNGKRSERRARIAQVA